MIGWLFGGQRTYRRSCGDQRPFMTPVQFFVLLDSLALVVGLLLVVGNNDPRAPYYDHGSLVAGVVLLVLAVVGPIVVAALRPGRPAAPPEPSPPAGPAGPGQPPSPTPALPGPPVGNTTPLSGGKHPWRPYDGHLLD